jgi:hypothetical protein
MIEIGGISRTVAEWCEIIGRKITTVNHRIERGWPVLQALLQKPFAKGKYLK